MKVPESRCLRPAAGLVGPVSEARMLTVAQPWAWAIAMSDPEHHIGKPVENRTFATKWRGILLIHAALRWSMRGDTDWRIRQLASIARTSLRPGGQGANPALARGAVICARELEDCHPAQGGCCEPWGESEYVDSDGCRRTDVWHWVLSGSGHFAVPVPCRGGLGLRKVPADVAEACEQPMVGCRR